MKFSELGNDGGGLIQGYEPGRLFIGGKAYTESLVLWPQGILSAWGPANAGELAAAHMQAILDLAPQVVLLGTGRRQVFPDPEVYRLALRQGLGLEVMDTGAACRTYNILLSEGRRVVAGLIIV